jgi:PAS domain S-box-containing protein
MSDSKELDGGSLVQAIIDAMPDVIFYKDAAGVYRAGNKAWGELLGKPVAALLGKSDFDLFPQEVASSFRQKDQEMLAQRKSRRNDEPLDYPDGRRVLVETQKSPVFDAQGTVIGLVGVCRDITERAKREG